MRAQISLLRELIADNFAGGGGASTGIELAVGRPVDIAVNHDADAILMHKTNHPYTTIVKVAPGAPLYHWPQVRALLNQHCGYDLADDEILLLWIGGVAHFIADIGLRMLSPRELYNANGFPVDYIIERDYAGREYPKSEQVARCGNAVPPPLATALVRANLPEWCGDTITTMRGLEEAVAG